MSLKNCLLLCSLFLAALAALADGQATITVDRGTARYASGEEAVFTIASSEKLEGSLPYAIKEHNNLIKQGDIDLAKLPVKLSAGLDHPGFLTCTIGSGKSAVSYGVAFEPEKIRLALDDEAPDFDAFWAEGLKQQQALPAVKLEKLPEYSNENHTSYLLTVPTVDGKQIYGFLSEPVRPGKYPLLLSVHGAGPGYSAPDTLYPDRGVVTLYMCIHDYAPAIGNAAETRKRYQEAYGKYSGLRDNTDDPRKHLYYRSHLGVSRAIDFAVERPNVDPAHVVISGGSQGGTYAIAMTALNPRITAAAAMVPGFCDHNGYLNGTGNSHFLAPGKDQPEKLAAMKKAAGYYDSAYFARRIKVPVLFSAAFADRTCTPHSVYAAYNLVTAPKEMIDDPAAGHTVSPLMKKVRDKWLDRQLGLK